MIIYHSFSTFSLKLFHEILQNLAGHILEHLSCTTQEDCCFFIKNALNKLHV